MNEFSLVGAWSLGYRFVTERPVQYAILLIGMGLLVPAALQIGFGLLAGQSPFDEPNVNATRDGLIALAGLLLGYSAQSGALFATLRLGFAERETFRGALAFGLLAGLIATGIVAALLVVAVMMAGLSGAPGIALFVLLATLVPVIVAIATYSPLLAAFAGAGIALVLTLTMIFGATTGNIGLAATLAGGGSGFIVVMLLLLSVVLLWLGARLSCVTAIMADHKRLNLFAAMRMSWDLTMEGQWRITLYLALIGLGLVIFAGAGLMALGAGAALLQAPLEGGPAPAMAIAGAVVFVLLVGVPCAFLSALVPAGIYWQLAGDRAPVEVFA